MNIKNELIKNINRNFLMELLKKNERLDGRDFLEYRDIEVKKGIIKTAEGSALVRIGTTQVLAGVKFGIVEPFASDPDQGAFIVSSDLLPLASESFEPGPPDERSIQFARVVDRGLRSAEVVNLNDLFIEEGKALGLFLDLYVLDYGGNLIDAGYLAGMAALRDTKMPKVEDGKIISGEYNGKLKINANAVSCTFIKIGKFRLIDPNLSEEIASDVMLSIAVSDEYVVAMQKTGIGSLKEKDILEMIDVSLKKQKELIKKITN